MADPLKNLSLCQGELLIWSFEKTRRLCRRLVLCIALGASLPMMGLPMAGCGFEPTLATPKTPLEKQPTTTIALLLPTTKLGDMLRDALAQNGLLQQATALAFVAADKAQKAAQISLSEKHRNEFINRSGQQQRQEITITAKLVVRGGDGAQIMARDFELHDNFNSSGDELAKQLALEASRQNLVDNLADKISRALIIMGKTKNGGGA